MDSIDDEDEDMPPPKPYFDRNSRSSTNFTNVPNMLLRSYSSPVLTQHQTTNTILTSATMTRSMSNLYTSRAIHNQSLGLRILAKPSESGLSAVNQCLQARKDEFDLLLQEL